MKLSKFRGELRQAELIEPQVYKRKTDPDDANCPECLGRGIIHVSEADRGGERHAYDTTCKDCGGSGLKLEGKAAGKAGPSAKRERASWISKAFEKSKIDWPKAEIYATLLDDVPDPSAELLVDLGKSILTNAVSLGGLRIEMGKVKAKDLTFHPSAFKKCGSVIQSAVIHDKDGRLLAIVDLAKGGSGIIHDGVEDVSISWDDGIFAL